MNSIAVTCSPREDVSENEHSKICAILGDMKCAFIHVRELATKWHSHFGILHSYKNTSAFGKAFKAAMCKHNPDWYPLKGPWYKGVTWYVGGPDYQPRFPNGTDGDCGTTWLEYLEKDGPAERSPNWPDNWEQYLAPNKDPKEQRDRVAAWGIMEKYEKLFHELSLPYTTCDEVWTGVERLAYIERRIALPRAAERISLRVDLYHYMNKCAGSLDTAVEQTQVMVKKRELAQAQLDEIDSLHKRAKLAPRTPLINLSGAENVW